VRKTGAHLLHTCLMGTHDGTHQFILQFENDVVLQEELIIAWSRIINGVANPLAGTCAILGVAFFGIAQASVVPALSDVQNSLVLTRNPALARSDTKLMHLFDKVAHFIQEHGLLLFAAFHRQLEFAERVSTICACSPVRETREP